ncbi:MAG: LuxR C-terminal-related transcriptional regulator [Motiliproteus sp.]
MSLTFGNAGKDKVRISAAVVGRYPLLNDYVSKLLEVHSARCRVSEYTTVDELLANSDLELDILVMLVDQHVDIEGSSIASALGRFSVRQSIIIAEQGCRIAQNVLRRASVIMPMGVEKRELELRVAEIFSSSFPVVALAVTPNCNLDPCITIFTRKQKKVLSFLRVGMSNKQIADSMGLAVSTVNTHMQSIYSKSGCRGRTNAVLMANRIML